jgi:hypothetical protein
MTNGTAIAFRPSGGSPAANLPKQAWPDALPIAAIYLHAGDV